MLTLILGSFSKWFPRPLATALVILGDLKHTRTAWDLGSFQFPVSFCFLEKKNLLSFFPQIVWFPHWLDESMTLCRLQTHCLFNSWLCHLVVQTTCCLTPLLFEHLVVWHLIVWAFSSVTSHSTDFNLYLSAKLISYPFPSTRRVMKLAFRDTHTPK